MNETIGNQQETISYIAGLFEGEGSFLLTKVNMRKRELVSYRSQIQFTNTEPELIQAVIDFFRKNEIAYHVRTDIRKQRKVCYQVSITRHSSKLKFIELIRPYLLGIKAHQLDLCKEFILYMVSKTRDRDDKGNFIKVDYTENERLYNKFRSLMDSSETKRRVPINFG